MNDTIADRVARGATWLDIVYPGWWKSINLGTLSISSCHRCVLGQVYSEHIPAGERSELVAQAAAGRVRPTLAMYRENLDRGEWGGFNVLADLYELEVGQLGFGLGWAKPRSFRTAVEEFGALTDEWTRVILSRRIDENLAEIEALWDIVRTEVAQMATA